jgi:hypothetical protein
MPPRCGAWEHELDRVNEKLFRAHAVHPSALRVVQPGALQPLQRALNGSVGESPRRTKARYQSGRPPGQRRPRQRLPRSTPNESGEAFLHPTRAEKNSGIVGVPSAAAGGR